jgi:hypothetical protein
VAAGLALPADLYIKLSKESDLEKSETLPD